jgi:hypothetical protein
MYRDRNRFVFSVLLAFHYQRESRFESRLLGCFNVNRGPLIVTNKYVVCSIGFSLPMQVSYYMKGMVKDKNLLSQMSRSYDSETLKNIVLAMCTPGMVEGDQIGSSSPADISFWPIHPTIDRLYQYKKLIGKLEDESWPTDFYTLYGSRCTGHKEDDNVQVPCLLSCFSLLILSRLPPVCLTAFHSIC